MTTASSTYTTIEIVPRECGQCGVVFGMSDQFYRKRLDDHKTWYCPNGHGRSYQGESEAEKLRRQLKNARANEEWERTHREAAERSLVATKGHVTRLRKQVLAGECPFCGQHLRDLERHITRQHKDEPEELPE